MFFSKPRVISRSINPNQICLFDKTKISDAICKAIVEVDGSLADDTKQLAYDIADRIESKNNGINLTVEQIQDMVENRIVHYRTE